MIGSKFTADHGVVYDDDDTESQQQPDGSVSCSICLESVIFNGGRRSTAKLHCGHEFHLDCIGSAFNIKGEMQCPNCRIVEKGRWLYSNGHTRIGHEFSMDEWQHEYNPDEEPYDVAFPELPYRLHWCPFGEITRVRSSFEEVDAPSATYHATFAEHAAGSSVAHSYVTYLGHASPPSLNSRDTVEFDDPGYNHSWNGLSGQNEITSVRDVLPHDLRHSRARHSPPTSNHANGQASNPSATLRPTPGEFSFMTRSITFGHPFLHGHGSDPRGTGSSFIPSNVPRHTTRNRDRIIRPHVINRSTQPATSPSVPPRVRRYIGARGVHSDQTSGFFVPENHLPIHTSPLERDYISHFPASGFDRDSSSWGSSHQQSSDVSDSGNNTTGNIWQRQW